MANNTKYQSNKHELTKGANRACKITFIIQVIITVALIAIALAPILSGLFGVTLFLFAGAIVAACTVISFGTFWIFEGFRTFWSKIFSWIFSVISSPSIVVEALQDKIIWLSIVLLVLSSVGFIVNLIYYIKTKENKGKFIASCVFLGIAIVQVILGICLYLTWYTWH